jgi:hypothetical protein
VQALVRWPSRRSRKPPGPVMKIPSMGEQRGTEGPAHDATPPFSERAVVQQDREDQEEEQDYIHDGSPSGCRSP